MPTFEITSPEGKKYRVTAPDGATPEQAMAHFRSASPTLMANSVMNVNPDVTDGMSTLDKVRAGTGMGVATLGRGLGQLVGAVSPADEAAARKRDASLADTLPGKVGNFIGQSVPAALSMFIPGANTYTGAALLGGLFGAAQPIAPGESRAANTGVGVAGGVLGQFGGNALVNTYRAGKAAAEPLYNAGQEAIMGRLLNKTAGGGQYTQDALAALQKARELVPGSLPTVGQAANNPGIAALERTAVATAPEVAAPYAARMKAQGAARVDALDNMGMDREFAAGMRDNAAKDLYKQAFSENPVDSPWIKGQFTQLMQRPAFRDALAKAQTLAANDGVKFDVKKQVFDPSKTTQIAHYTKKALDDAIEAAQGEEQRILMGIRDKLVSTIESPKFSPSYAEARRTYAEMSKPVNQADIISSIQDRSINKLTGDVMPSAYARSLTDKTAQQATGFKKATLAGTMEPDQMAALDAIKQDLARSQFAQNAGRGPGSDTVQKLAYSNMIDAAGVPSWLQNLSLAQIPGNLLGKGANVIYGDANKKMNARLAEMMLQPAEAARVMALPQSQQNEFMRNLLTNAGRSAGLLAPAMAAPSGLLAYPPQ